MIVSISVPSQATPTLILAQAPIERHWAAITNHGSANVFYSVDDARNTSSLLTVSGGAVPGIILRPGDTHFLSRNSAAAQSNIGPIYAVQQSGSAQQITVQYLP